MNDFLNFLQDCPTQYHLSSYLRSKLIESDFCELKENESWNIIPPKGFFFRDERELVAWNDNGHDRAFFAGSHSDFPCLILKPKFDEVVDGYRRCRCSIYGRGAWDTWFDRNLRLAGRLLVKCVNEEKIETLLYDSKIGIASIPSLEPHLDSSFSMNPNINLEKNLIPIYSLENSSPPLLDFIADQLNIDVDSIVGQELRFVDAEPPSYSNDLIHSQRLNGLQSTFAVFSSFLNSSPEKGTLNMITIFDNEQTGNKTRMSATSNAINNTLLRIFQNDKEKIRKIKANSFFVSVDSNHAQHPSYSKESIFRDVRLGNGICIKRTKNYKTACGMKNEFPIRSVVEEIHSKRIQIIDSNNYKQKKGSTFGPRVENKTGITTADIGIPVIGMRSIREHCSYLDIEEEMKILSELFNNYSKFEYPF
ncbi:Clan MH, family M18, aspartyl aminopeptidase-like metallopeptidase [Tritrichomonas foetus]|uniref:aspartyl aminopeptidase n=1 Tax=Tritrichomonas foetus TaxID=1144522 RepID=A0A1J4JCS5_9EUKA|nr:Clan MH, family M18, aspartyl aminopeptidase-like metallopeptidase [Tritrichomonas foetus]|eukprot:OHS95467.1 Clan MH, family M18, aspartyl aminopeptidase-like metallopeptidase [Tritrichomonas foetus]